MTDSKNAMGTALKTLGTGPALIKLRQKTSTPLSISNDAKPVIVEEHITLQATSWSEFGASGDLWKLTLVDGMDVVILANDIFAIFTKTSGVR